MAQQLYQLPVFAVSAAIGLDRNDEDWAVRMLQKTNSAAGKLEVVPRLYLAPARDVRRLPAMMARRFVPDAAPGTKVIEYRDTWRRTPLPEDNLYPNVKAKIQAALRVYDAQLCVYNVEQVGQTLVVARDDAEWEDIKSKLVMWAECALETVDGE